MTTLAELASAYKASRGRVDELTRSLDDASLGTDVPCCPAWTVKDLVGHLTGVLEDRIAGRMPSGPFTEWTHAQVVRHRDEPIDVTLDTWGELAVGEDESPPSLWALSFDVVTHEHDLFQALKRLGDRESASVRVGAERASERMGSMLTGAGAPGVIVTLPRGIERVEGGAEPIALSTTEFGLMRLVTGRMSKAEATAMAWDGDETPVLDALFADGFFTLQPVDVLQGEAF